MFEGKIEISVDASLPYRIFTVFNETKGTLLHVGILPSGIKTQFHAERYAILYALRNYRMSFPLLIIFNDSREVIKSFNVRWKNVCVKFKNPNRADDYIKRIIREYHGVFTPYINKRSPIYNVEVPISRYFRMRMG